MLLSWPMLDQSRFFCDFFGCSFLFLLEPSFFLFFRVRAQLGPQMGPSWAPKRGSRGVPGENDSEGSLDSPFCTIQVDN